MSAFKFKHFELSQNQVAMKVGTDAFLLGATLKVQGKKNVLDIGTGSGVLALMMAQQNQLLSVTALEIDGPSALEAKLNFENSPWKQRLELIHSDFLEFQPSSKFDLIVSNPPYFENGLLNTDKRKSNARHEVSLPMNQLFDRVQHMLTEDGDFWLILPFENRCKWITYASKIGLHCRFNQLIYGKPNLPKRAILSFSKISGNCIQTEFVIRCSDGMYSEEYKSLTREFHGVSL
jgi:tRNA1Val (adenine37-N6)-methyltransferase